MEERNTNTECMRFREELTPFMDRSLPADEEQAFSRHLADCPACRALLERTRRMLAELEAAGRVQAPPELAWAIKRAVDREERRERERRLLRPIPFGLSAVAAAAALVLLSWPGPAPTNDLPGPGASPLTSGIAEGARWERYVSPSAVDYRLPPDVRTAGGQGLAGLDSLRVSPPARGIQDLRSASTRKLPF